MPIRWYAWTTAPSRRATRPPRRSSWSSAFTLAMMWSRTWLHAHWLTNTAAGAATGAGAGLLVWWLFRAASPGRASAPAVTPATG
ncbi:phosphatase PAP2 family protein [Streptomyces virginiae]|uniref:phosphatase PAP2 family protein n=1 Tax=Streptomyces virginiae TaxID=1961 RepID=UPI003454EED0